jgi:cellulose biosynthesis protein BcsQ
MNDYYVISIESRKGGVGKTTAALNLSRLLAKRRQYAVLFLDVDITGTNIADSLNSPFWENYTKALSPHGNREHGAKLNLLELFDKHFMIGKNIYEFSVGKNVTGKCTVDLNSINIIGSQIYGDENDKKNGNHYCICSPSILFDELHSFWFVAFLKELSANFTRIVGKKGKHAVIVIDNSPGFVGISPVIHQWLTDIGPERGKFLTVSTLDEQDLISCCYAVNIIHEQLSVKHDVVSQMESILNGNAKITDTNKEIKDKKFFLRILEEKNDKNSDLKYYLNL